MYKGEKPLKKLFSIVLAIGILLTLAACHSAPTTAPETEMKTIYVLLEKKCTESYKNSKHFYIAERNTYDEQGKLIQRELGFEGGKMIVQIPELDEYCRVVRMTRVDGDQTHTWEYTYDQYGNLTLERQLTNGDLHWMQEWIYDAEGKLLSMVIESNPVKTSYTYVYENGVIVQEIIVQEIITSQQRAEVIVYDQVEEYDEQGRRVKQTRYQNGEVVQVYQYSYSEDGLTTYTQFGGITVAETVDENGNLVRYEQTGRDSTLLYEYTYQAIQIPADNPRRN